MNKREAVLATLRGEEPGVVPGQITFFSINSLRKLVPIFSNNWRDNALKRLEFLDNSFIEIGSAKLHQSKFLREADELERVTFFRSVSGGGVLRTKLIEEKKEDLTFEFETGGKWRVHKNPFWREYIHHPIQDIQDLERMKMPNPNEPKRYEGVKENIEYFKEKGYFTSAEINGFFSGVWYRYQNMQDFMANLLISKEFAKKVVNMVGGFNLETARNFLERGVDSILFCDDLGSNTGMLISPDLYKNFFYPWHKKLAKLCHNYDAYLNMHSHGNINKIMPLLVEAGIDILNPVGPFDNMDLGELKERYGDRITFMGGISKFIGKMGTEELKMHLKEVVETGSPGGGFILMSEGGIPDDMSREDFKFYLEINKKYRGR